MAGLTGGSFTTLAGATSSNLARFIPTTPPMPPSIPPRWPVNAVAVLSDNSGIPAQLQGFPGSIGTASWSRFQASANAQLQGQINVIVQTNGQIIMGGSFINLSQARATISCGSMQRHARHHL